MVDLHIQDDSEDDEYPAMIGTLKDAKASKDWNVNVLLDGKEVIFKIDIGAAVTVIPLAKVPKKVIIDKTSKKLLGPGNEELKVLGKIKANLTRNKRKCQEEIYVIQGLEQPLLGRPAIEALNLLQRINSVKATQESVDFKKEFPELFTGLGKLQKEYKIQLKDDVVPHKISTPRRILVPLRKDVEIELQKLQEQDIIKKVTEPTDWCSGLVVVPKANGKISLCVDLTKLNEGVKRENFPLPLTEELLTRLAGGKLFTKLDCNSGFHQMPLAEESKILTTFITPFGRFCCKRLPFGISSGPELFHREMSQLVDDIPGVICDIDDILITVFYASRSLTSTETCYAQIEKEALAATWACEKFAGFLIGLYNSKFTIETDHKPLLVLLQKKEPKKHMVQKKELDELTPRCNAFA
ncbi:Pol polyprotein [Elysia marginata]|uniref:Pol polyprotein n=1 Tax=Elysia marginata TaxID=1093978 RepID=A0AAV4JIG7_9GAST|nr:Pol polyprotein [Elysia marginata]